MNDVFKILTKEAWSDASKHGYVKTDIDENDAFIHFTTSNQLAKTLHLFFDNIDAVVLLQIHAENIQANLVYEEPDSNNRAGKFPHLYGKLSTEDILNTWNIKRNAFELPLEILNEAEINSN